MEIGKSEAHILDQAHRNNMPIPDKIKNAPELLPGLDLYFVAFMELSTCRTVGMGEGPIPWTAMRDYAIDHLGVEEGIEFDRFVSLIRGMDIAYLEYQDKKRDSDAKANKGRSDSRVPKKG